MDSHSKHESRLGGDEYVAPALVRHGDIDEVTRGTGGPAADVGAPGSFFVPRPTPNP